MNRPASEEIAISGREVNTAIEGLLEINTFDGSRIRVDSSSVVRTIPLEPSDKTGSKRFTLAADSVVWLLIQPKDISSFQGNHSLKPDDDTIKKYVDDGSTESKSRDDDDESVL